MNDCTHLLLDPLYNLDYKEFMIGKGQGRGEVYKYFPMRSLLIGSPISDLVMLFIRARLLSACINVGLSSRNSNFINMNI